MSVSRERSEQTDRHDALDIETDVVFVMHRAVCYFTLRHLSRIIDGKALASLLYVFMA